MNVQSIIRDALKELTKSGTFWIDRIDYDEKNFGNVVAVLRSNSQVNVRFIKDKGNFWCELWQSEQWYFIEDVCALIGVAFAINSSDFADYTKKTAEMINTNITLIFETFSERNSKVKQVNIQKIAAKRALEMFHK
jgi:hypothetical protein